MSEIILMLNEMILKSVSELSESLRAFNESLSASIKDGQLKQNAKIGEYLQDLVSNIEAISFKYKGPLLGDVKFEVPVLDYSAFSDLAKLNFEDINRNYKENYYYHLCLLSEIEAIHHANRRGFKESLVYDYNDLLGEKYIEKISYALGIHLADNPLLKMWTGAVMSMKSDNPDKIRHCFVSLRTILEYLINTNDSITINDILNYVNSKYDTSKAPGIKIKLQAFLSKEEFNIVEDITDLQIKAFVKYYGTLCSLHSPDVDKITDEQANALLVKVGILIWAIVQRKNFIEGVVM